MGYERIDLNLRQFLCTRLDRLKSNAVKVVAEVAAPVMGWGVVIMVAMELASVVVEAVAQEQRLGEALDPQES